jgi:threonylcarbamoyladenosine tRNA methylthiotransferase MtaB
MARFSVDFLGCKVSHVDAQELRERLAAEGHLETTEAVDVAVINTCCVTHEAVRKSRQAARRAARRAARVYVTGCGARLQGAFDGLPANVTVVSVAGERAPEFVARDVGAIGCVRASVGLDRVRAFVKVQDGCGNLRVPEE